MKKKELGKDEKELLSYCLKEHAPDLLADINRLDRVGPDRVNEIRNAVGDELTNKGFEQDWEPNRYGLQLEDLIDKLADLYIWPDK
jgi:hypothetical protein